MRNHDTSDDPLACQQSSVLDEIEPAEEMSNEYRDAAIRMLAFMHAAFTFIHQGRSNLETIIRLWAVSSAIDHPAISGRSDIQLAEALGTTRANFSKHVIEFERENSLPPTASQKSVAARGTYRAAREAQLNYATL